jgi:hypothetical protein
MSQEAPIRLAPLVGVSLNDEDSPGAKLKAIQDALEHCYESVSPVFKSVGCYLGHIAAQYHSMYGADSILLLGRVMSGQGGELILEEAKAVLDED